MEGEGECVFVCLREREKGRFANLKKHYKLHRERDAPLSNVLKKIPIPLSTCPVQDSHH